MRSFGPLLRYPRQQWARLLAVLLLNAGIAAAAALQPWPLKWLVDYGLKGEPAPEWFRNLMTTDQRGLVAAAAVGALALFVINVGLEIASTWTWTVVSQRMVYALAGDLFARFQRLSLSFHLRQRVGDLLNRLTSDTWAIATATEALLVAPARQLFVLVPVGILAWLLDPVLAAITLGLAPVLGGAAVWLGPALKRSSQKVRDARSRLQSLVHQTVSSIPLVQTYGLENRQRGIFDSLATNVRVAAQRESRQRSLLGSSGGLVLAMGTGVVLFVGGQRVWSGQITLGSLLVFLGYVRTLQTAFRGLLGIYGRWKSAEASLDRVLEVITSTEDVPELPGAVPLPPRAAGQPIGVTFENVTFGYAPDRPVLRDLSLVAEPGDVIALVGKTGAGKSTLASLIPRMFDPWNGRVSVDGRDVRTLQLRSLRQQISIVLQEPFLLPLTVAHNIAYSRPTASRAQVVAAAVAAEADEFIRELPQGYDTVIGERGLTLSGGQRQRLAIARAVLREAPLLILDEPSSALDAETEARFLVALQRLIRGRTTFIIAHRFSTIRFATRIAVLDGGRIVELGTHQELLALGGLYERFYSLQTSAVREESVA